MMFDDSINKGDAFSFSPQDVLKDFNQLMIVPLSIWRRCFDIIISIIALILLSPLLIVVSILIKVTSYGPILFKQERTGIGCRRFIMYKFRTMRKDAEENLDQIMALNEMSGPLIKVENDPRRTRIGKILRKTSIDELPQIINVIKGDMTIIGPRPLSPTPDHFKQWQLKRFDVTPGIACKWQADHRDETDFEKWMRTDVSYVNSKTTFKDVIIFARVLKTVFNTKGGR